MKTLLLKPGRRYEDAVKRFSPYEKLQEMNAEGRAAGAKLVKRVTASELRARGYIFVNNRFEGNALASMAAMVHDAAD